MLYQLSYGPLLSHDRRGDRCISGQGRNRTTDTAIFSRVLYQLSYLAFRKRKQRLLTEGDPVVNIAFF